MKVLKWIFDNSLFLITLFLLMFIPLYPKRPLVDIVNTWVYIRLEDFVVVASLLVWIYFLIRKKITLKTPLTLPIILFWIVGGIATIHGVLFIFPFIPTAYPNVAFLSFLRRVEYISLFFIGFAAMKQKKFISFVVWILVITLILVSLYGIGQKYLGFPAFLTMNEEFAKGFPIQLSRLSRIPSTFGGHYDLAAYLVLIIPILASMIFGFRNLVLKGLLLSSIALGFIVLFYTVSRVSFFVLLISLLLVLFFQKKKLILFSLPILIVVIILALVRFAPTLSDRLGNTVKQIDVLVDANTGTVIGHTKVVPSAQYKDYFIRRRIYVNKDQLNTYVIGVTEPKVSTFSAIVDYTQVPKEVTLIVPLDTPTGENLPQGTGYINLTLSPVAKRLVEFFHEIPLGKQSSTSAEVFMYEGNFLVKKASAYDLSFTTRFQGEWPKAIESFRRNIFFGSGYSSISLSIDNNYLRILGEVGLLGFASYFLIFLLAGIYIRKTLPHVESPVVRNFVLGFCAGVLGLVLNATLIDVFEASKVAFVLWLLTGITLGTLAFYQTKNLNLLENLKKVLTSNYTITISLLLFAGVIFSPMIHNYFTGDDFTWLRWVADCGGNSMSENCPTVWNKISNYFLRSDGFFYRPGTKIYFYGIYSLFWLNQTAYHIASIFLHFIVSVLVFFLAKRILRSLLLGAFASFLFLVLSGYSEVVFWISSSGYLFQSLFTLSSILLFMFWEEKKKNIFLTGSVISIFLSLLFHELGVVTPLLIIAYKFATDSTLRIKDVYSKSHYLSLFVPVGAYLIVRFFAQSHWFSGDYSYNLLKLPFNVLGNIFGYLLLSIFGTKSLSFYTQLRELSRENLIITFFMSAIVLSGIFLTVRMLRKQIKEEDKRIVLFSALFFVISLLPFLGLGNITSRYSYLSAVGFAILFVFFIKKMYEILVSNGKYIALLSTVFVLMVFYIFHIIQLQQAHTDWAQAAEKSNKFLVSIDKWYESIWNTEPMRFYFVNVPTRIGQAWIFPVGIQDALWFSFQNPKLRVHNATSLEEALDQAEIVGYGRVFEFDSSGTVEKRVRPPKIK